VRDKGLPILYKEFIVHTAQIDEAIRYGYSAVLLIRKILPTIEDLDILVQYALDHQIEPLVEVDNAQDLSEIMN
jgi:indole-3-glycerol phosphate synthase